MSQAICRWGILGTAGIARKNWHSIRSTGNGTLVAVGSRDAQRATRFIQECQRAVPFDVPPQPCSYEALLSNPEIDAVYIPLPTGVRKDWVVRAARAGKHVVCEKPCGVNSAEVAEMLAACRENNVQFMDGVMFLHSRRITAMREILDDLASIGRIRRIATQFSFRGEEEFLKQNIRVSGELEPLGCLGDLGWYNIRFTLWVMNHQLPQQVTGRILAASETRSGKSVPLEFAGEMFFSEGVSATFYCSFVTDMQQWADVSGTHGRVHLRDFVLPYFGSEVAFELSNDVFSISECHFNMEEHTRRIAVREYSNNAPTAQESNLFRTFGQLVLTGKREPSWGEYVLQTQKVVDACLASARSGKSVSLA
jgi:predicted dehydrogenase